MVWLPLGGADRGGCEGAGPLANALVLEGLVVETLLREKPLVGVQQQQVLTGAEIDIQCLKPIYGCGSRTSIKVTMEPYPKYPDIDSIQVNCIYTAPYTIELSHDALQSLTRTNRGKKKLPCGRYSRNLGQIHSSRDNQSAKVMQEKYSQ